MTAVNKVRPRATALPLSRQRLRLWLRLLRATRAIEAELRERLRVQFSLTLPQFDVLAALYRQDEGITMTELSRMLIVSNGNVTGIVDRLVADRLVARQLAPADRRSFLVRLTPKGRSEFATVARAHKKWIDKMLSEIDSAEAGVIIDHLDGLAFRVRNGGLRPLA
jgi:DNA-binding MarR family transcriptional regulator